MSFKATRWAYDQCTGSLAGKAVLVKLCFHADEDNVCWPSVARIAADLEMGERTVQVHLGKLEWLGFIDIERRTTERGPQTNVYRINLSGRRVRPGAANAPDAAGAVDQCAGCAPLVQDMHPSGAGDCGYIENHQSESSLNRCDDFSETETFTSLGIKRAWNEWEVEARARFPRLVWEIVSKTGLYEGKNGFTVVVQTNSTRDSLRRQFQASFDTVFGSLVRIIASNEVKDEHGDLAKQP